MNDAFIQRRNTLLIRLLWILLFVIIFSNSITRTITFYYALTLGIACLVNVVLMILNRSQKTVKTAMYLLICALSAVLFFVIYFKPNTPDYLWIFFALAVSSVYQRIGPVILTTIFLTFITLFYYFTPYKNDIFANASLSDIVYVLFAVYAPAGFMIAQSFISEKIQKEIQESEKKATRHFQQLKALFAESKHSSEAMDIFMETLQKEIHLNHAFSKESQEKLLDTTNNIHNQNTRIQHITSSVESLKEVLQSLNASSNQMTENVDITQTNSTKGKELIGNLSLQLAQLSKIIGESVEDMIHLQKDNEEISTILQTIEAISSQTNLLALNASIEASRAGEQGKGFMVIAEEIRRLADHSSLSTKQIHDILHNIYSKTEDTSKKIFLGDEMIRRGGHRMKEVEELFENIALNASELSTNSSHLENQILHEMKTSIFSISSEINEIYQLALHNGTNIEQTTKYSQKVSQQMEHIVDHLAILTKQLEGLKALHETK